MTDFYNAKINSLTRWFLRNWPITEGKKQVAKLFGETSLPREQDHIISDMKYGFKMVLNLKNKEHVRMFLYGEHDERYEIAFVRNIICDKDVVWDIGANVGYYSLLFSKLTPNGDVFSFEPVSGTREYLVKQVELNFASNISVMPYALGDRNSEVEIWFSRKNLGEGTASILKDKSKTLSEKIPVKTIDEISESTPFPTFIKIDVEGFQNHLFRGGKKYFTENAPLIMAELRDTSKTMLESEKLIRGFGFEIFEIKKKGALTKCPNFLSSKARNFLLCKPDSLSTERINPFLS